MDKIDLSYKFGRISSEFKDCALPLTADQYTKCSFGCQYCFGVQFKENNPACKKSPGLKMANPKNVIKLLRGESPENPYYKHFYSKRFVLHWGGLTEPFDYIERKYGIGLDILKVLGELKYPTLFSTKGLPLFVKNKEYMDIFLKNKKDKNFAFQFSIITNSDEMSELIEPNTPNTTDRLKAMEIMSQMGYYTILRLRPMVVGVTDIDLEKLLTRAKRCGAKGVSAEFFAMDERVIPFLSEQFNSISDIVGFDVVDYYKTLSPTERGTYLRLNRTVKEPFMERLYTKCRELGLAVGISDPDFKELNDYGCCCCLPEEYPDNPEITNWSKGQLTYHLKELRKRYWASDGKDNLLTFPMVKSTIHDNWMDEHGYFGDSIKNWQVDYAEQNTGHIREYIESWNNLRSPDNPYNHYHGKLKPIKVLQKKIVYEYVPSPYEYRWKEKGIL